MLVYIYLKNPEENHPKRGGRRSGRSLPGSRHVRAGASSVLPPKAEQPKGPPRPPPGGPSHATTASAKAAVRVAPSHRPLACPPLLLVVVGVLLLCRPRAAAAAAAGEAGEGDRAHDRERPRPRPRLARVEARPGVARRPSRRQKPNRLRAVDSAAAGAGSPEA